MHKWITPFSLLVLLMLAGCSRLPIDPSTPAVEAGDYTVVMSACGTVPGLGVDSCVVKENTEITSSWKIILPKDDINVIGGDIDVYYRDLHKQYPITGKVTEIQWAEFFGKSKWNKSMDGEVLALVLMKYTTDEGIEEIAKFRGIAKIIVTKPGYDRIPLGSSFSAWDIECKIEYSTAGRGAIKCR